MSTTSPSTMSAADLLQVFAPDVYGNLASEKYYGGDNSPVTPSSSELCAQTLPASAEYQINHSSSYGVRATTQFSGSVSAA